ncbi:MAG: tyrosine-type recombinase/integrase [Filomicrobium sp.]
MIWPIEEGPTHQDQIAILITKLTSSGGERTTIIALRLALLTFVRPKELRGAEWSEINLDCAEWRIPAKRMKMRDPHIVPLSKQALGPLRELHTLTGDQRQPKTACMRIRWGQVTRVDHFGHASNSPWTRNLKGLQGMKRVIQLIGDHSNYHCGSAAALPLLAKVSATCA